MIEKLSLALSFYYHLPARCLKDYTDISMLEYCEDDYHFYRNLIASFTGIYWYNATVGDGCGRDFLVHFRWGHDRCVLQPTHGFVFVFFALCSLSTLFFLSLMIFHLFLDSLRLPPLAPFDQQTIQQFPSTGFTALRWQRPDCLVVAIGYVAVLVNASDVALLSIVSQITRY